MILGPNMSASDYTFEAVYLKVIRRQILRTEPLHILVPHCSVIEQGGGCGQTMETQRSSLVMKVADRTASVFSIEELKILHRARILDELFTIRFKGSVRGVSLYSHKFTNFTSI